MMKLWLNEPPLPISDNRHGAQSPDFSRTELLVWWESVRGRGWVLPRLRMMIAFATRGLAESLASRLHDRLWESSVD